VVRVVAQIAERRHPRIDDQHDGAARTAVAAVRPSARDVRLAPKGGGSIPAGAAGNEDPSLVSEHPRPMIATGLSRPGQGGEVGGRRPA
jgi:hypothetical protein